MARASDNGGGVGVLIFAGLAFLAYKGYEEILKPDVIKPLKTKAFVQRLQITGGKFGLDLKRMQASIGFVINNPNPADLKIQAIVGHITVLESDPNKPGFKIGDIDRFQPINIKPLSAIPVTLTASIKAINAAAYLAEVIAGKWKGQRVNFQGTVTANGTPYPVNETINMSA